MSYAFVLARDKEEANNITNYFISRTEAYSEDLDDIDDDETVKPDDDEKFYNEDELEELYNSDEDYQNVVMQYQKEDNKKHMSGRAVAMRGVVGNNPELWGYIDKISKESGITDHIVIMMSVVNIENLEYLIRPLRSKYLCTNNLIKPIVIVLSSVTDDAKRYLYDCKRRYEEFYVIVGNPSDEEDLFRCGMYKASTCIMLADRQNIEIIDGEWIDGKMIYDYLYIEQFLTRTSKSRLKKEFNMLIEVSSASTLNMMDRARSRLSEFGNKKINNIDAQENEGTPDFFGAKDYYYLPFIASGSAFLTNIFDSLPAQLFYNKDILLMFEGLLNLKNSDYQTEGMDEQYINHMMSIPCPDFVANKSFGEVFSTLLTKYGVIPISLYRTGSAGRYIHNGPPEDTIVRVTDYVYIVTSDDLKVNFNNAKSPLSRSRRQSPSRQSPKK